MTRACTARRVHDKEKSMCNAASHKPSLGCRGIRNVTLRKTWGRYRDKQHSSRFLLSSSSPGLLGVVSSLLSWTKSSLSLQSSLYSQLCLSDGKDQAMFYFISRLVVTSQELSCFLMTRKVHFILHEESHGLGKEEEKTLFLVDEYRQFEWY